MGDSIGCLGQAEGTFARERRFDWVTGCEAEDISYTVGFVSRKRPFSTEAKIELSYTVEKGFFDSTFFD